MYQVTRKISFGWCPFQADIQKWKRINVSNETDRDGLVGENTKQSMSHRKYDDK